MASGISAVFIVSVRRAFLPEAQILLKLFGAWCVVLLVGPEFVGCPDWDSEGCAVTEDESGLRREFLVRAIARRK